MAQMLLIKGGDPLLEASLLYNIQEISIFFINKKKKINDRHHVGIFYVSLFVLHTLEIALMKKVYASSWSFVRISAMA